MKIITHAFLALTCLLPLRADTSILANSSFANGNANWQGDAKAIEGDIGSMDSNPAGVTLTLKKDKWTKMYQLFTVRDKKLYYTITFQLSKDFKMNSNDKTDFAQPDLGEVTGMEYLGTLPESCISMLIQGGENWNRTRLYPDVSKLGQPQTLSGHINMYSTEVQSCFLLAFPPGEGSITFSGVSLSNVDPNAQQ